MLIYYGFSCEAKIRRLLKSRKMEFLNWPRMKDFSLTKGKMKPRYCVVFNGPSAFNFLP
jgi:hypothetical protein